MGKDAPADFIIASLSTGIVLIILPAIVPLFHRLPRRTQAKTLFALAVVQNVVVLVLASPFWGAYDRMHPKRIALQYHYNVSPLSPRTFGSILRPPCMTGASIMKHSC